MAQLLVRILLVASLATSAAAVRRMVGRAEELSAIDEQSWHCCCREEKCEDGALGDDKETLAVYTPDENVCCKLKRKSCGSMFSFSDYKITKGKEYCTNPQVTHYEPAPGSAPERLAAEPLAKMTPKSPMHTVSTYCSWDEGSNADAEEEDIAPPSSSRREIVNELVAELTANSINEMAREIFSVYVCMRWAPSSEFRNIASEEMSTKQLHERSVWEHYQDSTFVPMRCSRNVNVYGNELEQGQTHYEAFAAEIESLVKWFKAEETGAVERRMEHLERARIKKKQDVVESLTSAFDIERVKAAVRKCAGNPNANGQMTLNAYDASAEDLLADCAAAKWWLDKLEDWRLALPFVSFMSPDNKTAKEHAPQEKQEILVCFGKRVASQLHRRENGGHLMTDQSAVGCHGFWEMPEARQMLDRILQLWRPPTCQLAAMELEMKMKILELMTDMNNNLFDALPAMLVEEMSGDADFDGLSLKAAGSVGTIKGFFGSVISAFSSLKGKYQRLGNFLGNAVVKWVVCPLKPITNEKHLAKLDDALGVEDGMARDYIRTAYSKFTGAKDLLPGEDCHEPGLVSGTNQCKLAIMQEDMPEPYEKEDFLCPVQPLLPAKKQIRILKKKSNTCVLRMNEGQMNATKWFYRGLTPTRKQYEVMENLPTAQLRAVRIMESRSRPDHKFNIWRTFVTVANGCSQEEMKATPNFCKQPKVANPRKGALVNLLTGVALAGKAVGDVASAAAEAADMKEKTAGNDARTQRLGQWWHAKMKSLEKGIKAGWSEYVGRASTRYANLRQRLFEEAEANELVHSLSYQKTLGISGADNKKRTQYERFAVTVPCNGFDPEKEFDLKYTWTEKSLTLAKKALKFGTKTFTGDTGFRVELRGASVLHVKNAQNAWIKYSAYIRAAASGAEMPEFLRTANPFLEDMSGAFSVTDQNLKADDLNGFSASFACGTRQEMHDKEAGSIASFAECVKKGAEANGPLLEAQPGKTFFPDEIVVRVRYAPLEQCHHRVVTGQEDSVAETENPVVKNFMDIGGCMALPQSLPTDLAKDSSASTYRGMLLGKGLPTETLLEVLIDPAAFLQEVKL